MFLVLIFAFLVSFSSCYGSDSRCTAISGVCQENSHSCSGSYHTGLCDGHASRQCCTSDDSRCTAISGVCQENSHSCSGSYHTGLCAGHVSRQCCTSGHASGSDQFATGMVSPTCLQCICKHESGCRPLGCKWDVNSDSCGFFQLKEVYWIDCGQPGLSLDACSRDIECASQCVQRYMSRYIGFSGCAHNCESYARIHNGGPKGCKHSNTLRYWHDVQNSGCSANS